MTLRKTGTGMGRLWGGQERPPGRGAFKRGHEAGPGRARRGHLGEGSARIKTEVGNVRGREGRPVWQEGRGKGRG